MPHSDAMTGHLSTSRHGRPAPDLRPRHVVLPVRRPARTSSCLILSTWTNHAATVFRGCAPGSPRREVDHSGAHPAIRSEVAVRPPRVVTDHFSAGLPRPT